MRALHKMRLGVHDTVLLAPPSRPLSTNRLQSGPSTAATIPFEWQKTTFEAVKRRVRTNSRQKVWLTDKIFKKRKVQKLSGIAASHQS